ncbi:MAG TPA: M20/M25/M40 family metallo-hydrolase [Gemmatimonadaceae bacterium]|nr:M20/M25/M40 family metallo-hydrolase [Gemmatimonadaceae bacterium]
MPAHRKLLALIAVGFDNERGSGGWGVIEVFETYNTTAPAVTLTCEDYGLLHRLAENGQRPMVRLDLDAELLGEVPAFNTIGTIKGSEKPDEFVILSAHFDSWDGSSGATDNGTGTIMAMEAMRILKQAYSNPKRTIVVGHWAAEENGLIGSRAYAEDHPEVMRGLQALFNQDNGTGRVQSISAARAGQVAGRVAGELAGELRHGTEDDAAAAVMRRGSRLTRRSDASSPP